MDNHFAKQYSVIMNVSSEATSFGEHNQNKHAGGKQEANGLRETKQDATGSQTGGNGRQMVAKT